MSQVVGSLQIRSADSTRVSIASASAGGPISTIMARVAAKYTESACNNRKSLSESYVYLYGAPHGNWNH